MGREKRAGCQDLNVGLGARRRRARPRDGREGEREKENVNGKELPHEGQGLKTQTWLVLGKDMEGLRRMRLLQTFRMRKGLVLTTVCQVEVVEIGLQAWKSKSGP